MDISLLDGWLDDYATGTYSSRKIQTKTYEDLAFRFLSADQHPDHSTYTQRYSTNFPEPMTICGVG